MVIAIAEGKAAALLPQLQTREVLLVTMDQVQTFSLNCSKDIARHAHLEDSKTTHVVVSKIDPNKPPRVHAS
eukprot:4201312-Amphidinium_carterae.1